ncbi:hypothetical protein Dimus_013902 [Dionaea muscipula]
MASSFPPPPPPPSSPQPPPPHHQSPHPNRVEIIVFVENLPEQAGRREIFSLFSPFGCVTHVFVPMNLSRSGSKFDLVRFDSEMAAGLAILKVDGLKLKDKFLHVKRAAFGRKVYVLCLRKESSPSRELQEERCGRLSSVLGGGICHIPS